MINLDTVESYCCDDISLIENYDKAINDEKTTWHCHHRGEILPCGIYSQADLKKFDLYWNRPADELIFLTKSEHHRLHNKGKTVSEETRKKMSEVRKGKPTWNKGKHLSEESKRKNSEAHKGKKLSEETKKKMSEAKKGKTFKHSEETKEKMSESLKNKIWITNGLVEFRIDKEKEIPNTFKRGRLHKTK